MSNVIDINSIGNKIKDTFDEEILKETINTAISNLGENRTRLIRAVENIDKFFDTKYYETYFNELINCIDYSHGQLVERDGKYILQYKILFPIIVATEELLVAELDILLKYIYEQIHNDIYIARINRILEKVNMRTISHSVVSDVESRRYVIAIIVELYDGMILESIIKLASDVLEGKLINKGE